MNDRINCIIVDDEVVARDILENHLLKIDSIKIIGKCKNAIEAFNYISSQKIDLIFLDINMPEISGLSFAKSINPNIKVIFTTAYREYAIDGFNLKAVDYLLKPISFERLLQAVNKYLDEKPEKVKSEFESIDLEKSDFMFVRSDRKMNKVNFSEINFIESYSDYIKIHLNDHAITTRETISNMEAKLPKKDFLRVHRSFIVAVKSINYYTNETIEINRKEIPISRNYKEEVLKKLQNNS